MSKQKLTLEEAKQIIKEGIGNNIEYRVLRKELKGISRRAIKLIVLELMDEEKLSKVPFPELLRKPKKATQPLLVNSEGIIDVKELLEQKGYTPDTCFVKYSIGSKKITLTIKETKDNNVSTIQQ